MFQKTVKFDLDKEDRTARRESTAFKERVSIFKAVTFSRERNFITFRKCANFDWKKI